ncbi:MAG: serine hydrolase domain-containing protein [Armatimonadota bacterium]|nr:serine hydrolase domain-containing protein [Armatimonadota bacterium]
MRPGASATRAAADARRAREAVRDCLRDGIAGGVFPGAVAAVVQADRVLALEAAGWAQVVPRRRPMTEQTIFDLASVTKPVATATAVLQLWAARTLDLDAPVATYLPAFARAGKAGATVRHLLTHTAGLPAWEMLYLRGPRGASGARAQPCRTIGQAVRRICATPATSPPGTRVEYSDLGFVVLGYLVESLGREPLDRYVRRCIFEPLAMRRTRFRPPRTWSPRCAATEVGNPYERDKARAQGLGRGFRWRTRVIRGQVHDGNAWYVGRGLAGHAGLFGDARDLVRFGRAILGGGAFGRARVLPASVVAEAIRNQTPGAGSNARGLGWTLAGWPFVGTRASAAAFGHTGFTGTSLLIDPRRDVVVVLLTNRVHPRADNVAIQTFRPAFHDAVIGAVDG